MDSDQRDVRSATFLVAVRLRVAHLIAKQNRVFRLIVKTQPNSGVSGKAASLNLRGFLNNCVPLSTPFLPLQRQGIHYRVSRLHTEEGVDTIGLGRGSGVRMNGIPRCRGVLIVKVFLRSRKLGRRGHYRGKKEGEVRKDWKIERKGVRKSFLFSIDFEKSESLKVRSASRSQSIYKRGMTVTYSKIGIGDQKDG